MYTKKQKKARPNVMLVNIMCCIIATSLDYIKALIIVCFANFFLHHLLVE